MILWKLEKRSYHLKYDWVISRGKDSKKDVWSVSASRGGVTGHAEACFYTGCETTDHFIRSCFRSFQDAFKEDSNPIGVPSTCPSPLAAAIEMAHTNLLAQTQGSNLSTYLGTTVKATPETSYSIPVLQPHQILDFVEAHSLSRFSVLKIKVDNTNATAACKALADCYSGKIRVDANEAFSEASEVILWINKVGNLNIDMIEQPMPATKFSEYRKLKKLSPLPIIADESLQDQEVTVELLKMFHGVNIKLMKSRGFFKALSQIRQARSLGLRVMLGCMVETSLGIEAALAISGEADDLDLDGFLFFKSDPHDRVREKNGRLFLQNPSRK